MNVKTLLKRIEANRMAYRKLLEERKAWAIGEVIGKGRRQVDVARDCGVTKGRVNQWLAEARQGGA